MCIPNPRGVQAAIPLVGGSIARRWDDLFCGTWASSLKVGGGARRAPVIDALVERLQRSKIGAQNP